MRSVSNFARVGVAFLAAAGLLAAQDITTWHNDNARTGFQPNETILTPAVVNAESFGKVFSLPVTGDVYAQPLYLSQYAMADGKVHNVLFVATEQDFVYAFDADGNNPPQGYLWRRSLLGAGETWVLSTDVNTTDIAPYIGITGTPVIDRAGATLYVVAKSKTASGNTLYFQRLHALNLADGSEKRNGPTDIHATAAGSGDGGTTVSFSPLLNNQRPALLLAPTPAAGSPQSVFIGWSSHGDNGQYHGWIIGYNAANISQQTGAWTDTSNGSQGGIWMSGGGMAADGAGNVFAADGNGTFDANTGGKDFGDSAFRLTLSPAGLLEQDFFTPADQNSLNAVDNDMGTSAVTLLPTQTGSLPNLMVTSDKSGTIYLLNRDHLGGFTTPNDSSLQSFSNGGFGVHSSFAFFQNALYSAPDGGPLQSWNFNRKTERFNTVPQSQSTATYGCGGCDGAGSTPSISANVNNAAILWALDDSGFGVSAAILHAYDPADLATEYYNSTQATNHRDAPAVAVKFTTPTIVRGKVYVGGRNAVSVYGLLSTTAPATATPVFSPASGTYSTPQTVTISSNTPNASIYYTTDGSTPSTGSTLYSAPLAVSGSETIQAIALAPGLTQSVVASVTYQIAQLSTAQGVVHDGAGFSAGSVLLNGSAKLSGSRLRLTDGGANEAGSAYFPAQVNVQSFTTDFTFQLTNPRGEGFAFVIQNAGPAAIGPDGSGLGYGAEAPGRSGGISSSVAVKFDLADSAGEGRDSTGLYVDGASPTMPTVNLSTTGIYLHSGDEFQVHMSYNGATLTVKITDGRTHASALQTYKINIPAKVGASTAYVGFAGATGSATATQEIVRWTYAPTPYLPGGITASDGLQLNGSASIASAQLRLTDGGVNEAGSAFFPTTVDVSSFQTTFSFQLNNAAADGFTFVIQNAGVSALGPGGSGLGYGENPQNGGTPVPKSVAIKFDLYDSAGEGFDSTGLYFDGAAPTVPAVDLSSTGIDLHSGDVFLVHLVYDGTKLSVAITDQDTGARASHTYTVDIPSIVGGSYAYVGFTGGTGGLSAEQSVLTWKFE